MGEMMATDLAPEIWNAIADLVTRSSAAKEIYFVKVTKVDAKKLIVWAQEFGDLGIPLVAQSVQFDYYDTLDTGAVNVRKNQPTKIVPPKVGQTVCVLDAAGAKRFPICIGVVQSKTGYWEGG